MSAHYRQRLLLPYRLARQACAELIRDEVRWMADTAEIERLIERVERTAEWHAGQALYSVLRELMNRDHANSLCADLLAASKEVALFEQEWKFLHGFALVPLSNGRAVAAATPQATAEQQLRPTMSGGAR